MIYQPAEDSYLLQESLKNFLKSQKSNIKILDMGSGSGIQAQTCKSMGFENITTSDIDVDVIKHLKLKNLNPVHSDLFSKIPLTRFNLIIFNPPYLPEDGREPLDSRISTTGGKKGYELTLRFLFQAKNYLTKNGVILILISTLTNPEIVKSYAKSLKYNVKRIASKKIPFEELIVLKITNK